MNNILFKILMLKGDAGNPTDEQTLAGVTEYMQQHPEAAIDETIINSAVGAWLDDHPEATTTVQDGAITRGKINSGLLPYILNGEAYTVTNINNDLGAKVNSALASHDVVIVPSGDYTLEQPIVINEDYKTLIVLGNITYNGNDYAIELYNCRFCKLFVNLIECLSASCIKVQADSALCQLNEIHSMYLHGKICIDINATGTGTSGVQFTSFYSNYIQAGERGISITSDGNCWCGEIKFYSGEVNGNNAVGVYTNGNTTAIRAFGLTFESLLTAIDLNGETYESCFYGTRNEGVQNIKLSGRVQGLLYEGSELGYKSIDYSGLTHAFGIIFRGVIFGIGGVYAGNQFQIAPNLVGFVTGPKTMDREYQMISTEGEIGGSITAGCFPTVARITAAGTYTLNAGYGAAGIKELIIYAEKAGITVKNYDGTKTLFTTADVRSVWRITGADGNGHFSPSGYLVEKLAPVL